MYAAKPEIEEDQLFALLRSALVDLQRNEAYLLENDLNERTITHKLAEYLQPLLWWWNVDCEYNRDGHESKRVNLVDHLAEEWGAGSNVYPDIIVHHRGDNLHNLLIIEAKKVRRFDGHVDDHDRRKIEAFARELDYTFGAAVALRVGEEDGNRIAVTLYSGNHWHPPEIIG
jgi:hypothetical protein